VEDELFTRDEVQAGGVSRVRRARALVFLIEQESNRSRDRQTIIMASAAAPDSITMVDSILTGDLETMRGGLPGEQDAAFIDSFRNARRVTSPAQFKALSSHLRSWKVLIPGNLPLRAELLHQLSLRHSLAINKSKGIAAAFGVGSADFDAAYQTVTGSDVSTAFTEPTGLFARFKRKA
jgi:hypothetical protein